MKKINKIIFSIFTILSLITYSHFVFATGAIVCPIGQSPSADSTTCIPDGTVRTPTGGDPNLIGTCTLTGSQGSYQDQETKSECDSVGGSWLGPYVFLAPLPCDNADAGCDNNSLKTFDPSQANNIGGYLNLMIKIFIGICAVLAVVMIVMGGLEYMTSELISGKEAGKERIRGAIFGLVLALASWTLLNQINPNILNTDLGSLTTANVNVNVLDVPILNSIYNKPASDTARCVPITSGPCAQSNLTSTFGSYDVNMSKICNVESGGNPNSMSGTDKGTDGNVFSFGLFQVNLLANGSIIKGTQGESCTNLFTKSDGSPISGNNYIKKDANGKYFYDAKLKTDPASQKAYNDCKATLLDPNQNTQIAKQLFAQGNTPTFKNNPMVAWSGDMSVCASAFP